MRLIALLFVTTVAHAAPSADLSWLAGDWRRCKDGEVVEERWLGPRGDLMVGANLTSSQGKASFENLSISRADDTWTYWASPMGRPAVAFRMVEAGAQRAVFENKEHVFPARILLARRRRAPRAHRGHASRPARGGRMALREGDGRRLPEGAVKVERRGDVRVRCSGRRRPPSPRR